MAKSKEENEVINNVTNNVNKPVRYKVDYGPSYPVSLIYAKTKEEAIKKYNKMVPVGNKERVPLVTEYNGDVNVFADIQAEWRKNEEG